MNVLIDASIFVSALVSPNGPPSRVIQAIWAGQFELLTTESILGELETVLRRPAVLHYTRQSEDQIRHTIAAIRESSLVCSPTAVSVAGISAADANYLAAAVAGRADYLVTGDGDLLALQDYQGTRIVSAVEFLVELQLRRRR